MPPKAKRNAANTHKHENGLALPGRRIPKQRSHHNLHSACLSSPSPSSSPSSSPSPSPSLSHALANGKSSPAPPHPTRPDLTLPVESTGPGHALPHATLSEQAMPEDLAATTLHPARDRTASEASHDSACLDPVNGGALDGPSRPSLPRSPANGRRRNSIAYKSSSASAAMTIISSCPVWDVVAILIILLQLPSTVLTVIHLLFATLTFVPPSSTASLSSLPSFSEVFKGSQGMPSLGTIVICDLFALIIWGFLPMFAQGIAFDLAQAVIAISLGGAAAGKGGVSQSVLVCGGIIFLSHAYHQRPIRHYVLKYLHFVLSKGGFHIFSPPAPESMYPEPSHMSHGWTRSVLGLHILSQGILRLGRRWFIAKQDRSLPTTTSRRPDADGNLATQLPRSTPDSAIESTIGASADGRHPGPSPAGDGRERSFSSSSKKKKRQATQVRSQQPFWAAIASTKVTFWKEVQQSNDSTDSHEANSTDVNHIGNAHYRTGEDRVWILDVGATEITFWANAAEKNFERENGGEEQESSLGAGIDKSKPFYVRLNGTNWASTSITEAAGPDNRTSDGSAGKWFGKIFGLTSSQNYKCEFVRTVDRTTFHATSLITQSAPSAEQAAVSPPVHQSLRPQSPRTLLKNNVSNLEHELQELKSQQKRNQKSHGKVLAAAKKEVDAVESKIQTSGGNDDRLKQKKRQLSEAIRQAEEAAADMALQNSTLAKIPEADLNEYRAAEKKWLGQKDLLARAKEELKRTASELERELASAETEYASTVKKRERLQSRQTKLNEQHDRLSTLNAQDQSAHARKLHDRASLMSSRATHEQQYLGQIIANETQASDLQSKTLYLNQQVRHLQNLLQQNTGPSVPTTPEGPLPGTGSTTNNYTPVFQFPPLAGQLSGTPVSLPREKRGRSSSMLSDMSGFTDHNVDPPPAYTPSMAPAFLGSLSNGQFGSFNTSMVNVGVRKGSSGSSGGSGSGSGSGSRAGSQADPASPVNKSLPSPVGTAGAPIGSQ